jgi:serine phosphatase RsbU (regulator of sigma subunit)
MPEIQSAESTLDFPAGSELFLFTDGLYELPDPKGGRGSYDEFFAWLEMKARQGRPPWDAMLDWHQEARKHQALDDDVSMLHFATHS